MKKGLSVLFVGCLLVAGVWLGYTNVNSVRTTDKSGNNTPLPTATPQPTNTSQLIATPASLEAASERAQNFSGGNDSWAPFVQAFDGVEMVLVPAGCFEMGSADGDENERPVHTVCFDEPFWIDRYEVTNEQFATLGGVAKDDPFFEGDDRPRDGIMWYEAIDFCTSRGARLPTEAEWEYAAAGPDGLTYPWGNEWVSVNAVWGGNSRNQTANVGSRPEGASWVGAMDMSGNLWEWVMDWYKEDYYGSLPDNVVNPQGPSEGSITLLRGGTWYHKADFVRTSKRVPITPYVWWIYVGFRCARSF